MKRYFKIVPFHSFFNYKIISAMAGMSEDEMAEDLGFKSLAAFIGESIFIKNDEWVPLKLNQFCERYNLPIRVSQRIPKGMQKFYIN